jgi:hypothetical protein
MQPHNVEGPKGRSKTFWLLVVIVGLLAAITVNLLGRL